MNPDYISNSVANNAYIFVVLPDPLGPKNNKLFIESISMLAFLNLNNWSILKSKSSNVGFSSKKDICIVFYLFKYLFNLNICLII